MLIWPATGAVMRDSSSRMFLWNFHKCDDGDGGGNMTWRRDIGLGSIFLVVSSPDLQFDPAFALFSMLWTISISCLLSSESTYKNAIMNDSMPVSYRVKSPAQLLNPHSLHPNQNPFTSKSVHKPDMNCLHIQAPILRQQAQQQHSTPLTMPNRKQTIPPHTNLSPGAQTHRPSGNPQRSWKQQSQFHNLCSHAQQHDSRWPNRCLCPYTCTTVQQQVLHSSSLPHQGQTRYKKEDAEEIQDAAILIAHGM
jgi:hypothetical protein